jgi:hypothetical protein
MIQVTKTEVLEVLENMNKNSIYTKSNSAYQFVSKENNTLMFRYDLNTNKYKFYDNAEKFAKAIVRFYKRGY